MVYQAYKDETPVICGGRKVTGWKPVPGKPYFVASVPVKTVKRKNVLYPGRSEPLHPRYYDIQGLAPESFAPYFAQLHVNGVRAERARSHDVVRGSRKSWWDDPLTTEWRDGDLYQANVRSNIEVQASNDPEFQSYPVLAEQNEVPWYNKTTSHASNLWEKFVNLPTPFRYLRVKSTKGPGSLNFAEFAAFGHPPAQRKP